MGGLFRASWGREIGPIGSGDTRSVKIDFFTSLAGKAHTGLQKRARCKREEKKSPAAPSIGVFAYLRAILRSYLSKIYPRINLGLRPLPPKTVVVAKTLIVYGTDANHKEITSVVSPVRVFHRFMVMNARLIVHYIITWVHSNKYKLEKKCGRSHCNTYIGIPRNRTLIVTV